MIQHSFGFSHSSWTNAPSAASHSIYISITYFYGVTVETTSGQTSFPSASNATMGITGIAGMATASV